MGERPGGPNQARHKTDPKTAGRCQGVRAQGPSHLAAALTCLTRPPDDGDAAAGPLRYGTPREPKVRGMDPPFKPPLHREPAAA